MRFKPKHLPQISAPYKTVVDKLDNEGVSNEILNINPEELNPLQGIVFSDRVKDFVPKDDNPIYVSKDNGILDGHHRFISALNAQEPIKCVKIDLNDKDGARVLNKIQDIFEYEEQQKMEEVVAQDVINSENEIDSGDFIDGVNEDEKISGEKTTINGYREKPIMENSVIGNFFLLNPVNGYDKYEIEFENLLNTNDLGINCNSSEVPINTLANAWFPNIDFEKLSAEHDVPVHIFKNKAISDKASEMGYDGIKYGDILLQGLK